MNAHDAHEHEQRLLSRIEQVAAAHDLPSDRAARAAAVASLSETYTRRRERVSEVASDRAALLARLVFFLPRDVVRVRPALDELRRAGALPPGRRWRVLDLGAGLGATTLGVASFAAEHGRVDALEVTAVDRDAGALALLSELLRDTAELGLPPVRLEPRPADVRTFEPPRGEPYDLVVAGLVLNELWGERFGANEGAALARRWVRLLAPGGSVLILEPALRETARRLMRVRDLLADEGSSVGVFAPCARGGPCPMLLGERDWCHTDVHGPLPPPVAELAAAAGLRTERRSLAHLTLRSDGRRLDDGIGGVDGRGSVPTASIHRVVSSLLRSKGKREVMLCGEAGLLRCTRLERHRSEPNMDMDDLSRGDVVEVRGGTRRGEGLRVGPEDGVRRLMGTVREP
jgi:SAM-dependent methyltransferase